MEEEKNTASEMEANWVHPTCWQKTDEFIKKYGKQSEEDADLVNSLFQQNKAENPDPKSNFKTVEANKILDNFPNMPFELKCIYKVIGNPFVEYYFNNWTLRSLKHVDDRFKVMKEEGNNERIVDFSVRYCGMGHCVVCSYDTKDGKIFYRRDGGSNGWDRKFNWEFISKYVPEDEKKYNFMRWITYIKNDDGKNSEPWKWLTETNIVNP